MPELQTPALEQWSIEPRSESIAARAAELWRYRRMFLFFGDRAIRKLYQQTVLGKAWIFLRPLVPLFARVFLFGALLEVGNATRAPYFVFLAVGSAAWELFASCVMWATRSMQMNGGILSRLYVPRVIVPIATMAPGFVYFFINVGVIAAALAYYRIREGVWHVDSTWMIVAPAAAVLIILFAVSIGLWTSVLAAEARDVRFGLAFALEFWTYVTPVVYPLSLVPGHVQWALMLNPMAVYVVAFRGAILGGEGPSPWAWVSAIGITVVMLVIGLAFFQRAEAEAVDSL